MIKVLEKVRIIKVFIALSASWSVWFHERCWFSCEFYLPTDMLVRFEFIVALTMRITLFYSVM